MAELADAQASGACGSNIVWVQVPSSALKQQKIRIRITDSYFLLYVFISQAINLECVRIIIFAICAAILMLRQPDGSYLTVWSAASRTEAGTLFQRIQVYQLLFDF